MDSSESPFATFWSSTFSIIDEFMQPTWLHWVRICLQLHTEVPTPQKSLPPICLARSVCCAPAGATNNGTVAIPSRTAVATKLRSLVMALSQSNRRSNRMRQRLRRGRLLGGRQHEHRAAIGQQRDQCPEHHRDAAKPNPFDQRIQKGMNHRHLRLGIDPGKNDV